MKINKQIPLIILGAFLLFITFSSCKKDKETTPTSTTGSLMFHLHTMADTTEVENYGDTLFLSDGRQIAVNNAQLYISNIKLIKTDGTVVDGPSAIVLMKQGVEEYELGTVPVGNYKSVRFDVGLSNATNSSTPSTSDQTLYQPSMWFGPTAQPDGFVFVNFQGLIDTTDALSGTNLAPFTYKIGTTARRVTVTMPDENYSVSPDQSTSIHMAFDYAHLLDGVNLKSLSNLSVTTAAQNSGALATQIANNIADGFEYE